MEKSHATMFVLLVQVYCFQSFFFTLDFSSLLKNHFECSFVSSECSLQSSECSL